MKTTVFFLLIILLFKQAAMGAEVKKAPIDTWNQLWSLNQEEIKLLEKLKNKNDQMSYRLFELYSEEAKLLKEKENKVFIEKKLKFGKKIKREQIFVKTLKSYNKAKRLGHKILKEHKLTPHRADIYYTLALNSRDFAYDKKTERYLLQSLQHAPKFSEVEYQAKIGLAEYYYNEKKYTKARKIFSKIIENTSDSWHTKHLFNYGWCQFKTGEKEKAIYTLRDSYLKSSMEKYIDIRAQLRESLIIFFVHVANIQGGAKFFIEHEKNAYPSLLKMLKKIANKGDVKKTEKLIETTENYLTEKNLKKENLELQIEKLAIYKKFKIEKKFYAQANHIKMLKITNEQKVQVKDLIKNVVGLMQIRLGKGYDFTTGEYDAFKLKRVQAYYDLMAYFDKKNLAYYYYLQAESFYSVGQFKMANQQYKVALETYKKVPAEEDIRMKIMDSLFSSLDKGNYAQDYLNENLIYAYENYIAFWPKDSKSNLIYEKLINLLINEKRIEVAENYLKDYSKNFKTSLTTHQALAERVLDSHIKNKNTIKLAGWIKSAHSGYLKFKVKRITKLESILAQILFKGLHKYNQEGKYLRAINGYRQVFDNVNFSQKVKSEASHHIATVHSYLANHNKALEWLKISLKLATDKEIKVRKKLYFNSFDRFILLQNLEGAISWSNFMLEQYCSDKDKLNDRIVEKNFHILKAVANLQALQDYQKQYSKCSNKVDWVKLEKDKLNYFYTNNFWSELSDSYYANEQTKIYRKDFVDLFSMIFETSLNRDEDEWLGKSKKILTRLNCKECLEKVMALKEFEKYQKEINLFIESPITFGETFDEKVFNNQFTTRIERVKKLFVQGDHILQYKFYYTSLKTLRELKRLSKVFGEEVINFAPPMKEKAYLKSFQAQMKGIASNFINKSKEYKLKASYLIQNQKLFLENRKLITLTSDVLTISNILVPAKYYVYSVHKKEK